MTVSSFPFVPDPPYGCDRLNIILVQFRPDVFNMGGNRGIITFSVQTENSLINLFPCKHLPFIAGKKFTDHILAFGKGHSFSVYLYHFSRQVYFDAFEVQAGMPFSLFPAYMGVYSGPQFRDTKRLCQIVVSAKPQAKGNVICPTAWQMAGNITNIQQLMNAADGLIGKCTMNTAPIVPKISC